MGLTANVRIAVGKADVYQRFDSLLIELAETPRQVTQGHEDVPANHGISVLRGAQKKTDRRLDFITVKSDCDDDPPKMLRIRSLGQSPPRQARAPRWARNASAVA